MNLNQTWRQHHTPRQHGNAKEKEQNTVCTVRWEGVTPQWFDEVFMQTPEVKAFVDFGKSDHLPNPTRCDRGRGQSQKGIR